MVEKGRKGGCVWQHNFIFCYHWLFQSPFISCDIMVIKPPHDCETKPPHGLLTNYFFVGLFHFQDQFSVRNLSLQGLFKNPIGSVWLFTHSQHITQINTRSCTATNFQPKATGCSCDTSTEALFRKRIPCFRHVQYPNGIFEELSLHV